MSQSLAVPKLLTSSLLNNMSTETNQSYRNAISVFAMLGYESPSRDMESIGNGPVPQRRNCFREKFFPNKAGYFLFSYEISADGPNAFGLLMCRLFNASDEEMADDHIFISVAWNTAPGGKFSLFDVDKDWLPIHDFIKGRGIDCLDDEPSLLQAVVSGSNLKGIMVELPEHQARVGFRRKRRQGQDNTNP